MFKRIITRVVGTKEMFGEQVRDAFGRSIDHDVFQPILDELGKLECTYKDVKDREGEIQILTEKLRMLL